MVRDLRVKDGEKEIQRVRLFCQIVDGIVPQNMVIWMINNGFFIAPASTKHHGAYEGGLFDHSFHVMEQLVKYAKMGLFYFRNERSHVIVGLLHDLCKIDLYTQDEQGFGYTSNSLYSGHGEKSIQLISRFMTLTEEEILCIRYHMGAYEKNDWDYFDKAIKKYPSVLWTHQADMVASKILECD